MPKSVVPVPAFNVGSTVDVYVEQCNVTIPHGIVATRRLSKDGVWWYVVDCTSLKVAANERDITVHKPK